MLFKDKRSGQFGKDYICFTTQAKDTQCGFTLRDITKDKIING